MRHKINCKPYKNTIKTVLVDDREQDRKDYAMEQYAPFNPSIKHLRTGDFIFIGHNGVEVAFEYKTVTDFLTSINHEDNHLHNQVFRMIHDYDYCFVMIEAEDINKAATKRFYQTGLQTSVQEINGAISDLNTVCTVLQSQTRFGAFDLMIRVSGKIIQQKPFLWKYGKKSNNAALNYLNSIHGLKNKAVDIVDTLGLRKWEDLNKLTVEELMKVDGIGKVTAMNIINELR